MVAAVMVVVGGGVTAVATFLVARARRRVEFTILCARARRCRGWCNNSAHLGVSIVRDRTFFLRARARGGGGGPFFCVLRGAVVLFCAFGSVYVWDRKIFCLRARAVGRCLSVYPLYH